MEIYMMNDGFHCGNLTKRGALAKGAKKITEDEIKTMFAEFFRAYCHANDTDNIVIKDSDGNIFIVKKLPTEIG